MQGNDGHECGTFGATSVTAGRVRPSEVEWDRVERGIFTPASVVLLVQSVRRGQLDESQHQALADFLNEAVRRYFFSRHEEESLSLRQRARMAQSLASACSQVLDACGVNESADVEDMYPALGPAGLFAMAAISSGSGGREAVQSSLDGVRRLRSYAKSMEQRCLLNNGLWEDNTVKKADLRKAGNRPNVGSGAFSRLLESLNEAFLHWWLEIPGRGYTVDGTADAPFIRFMSSVTNHMTANFQSFQKKEPSALASAWRRTEAAGDMAKLKKWKSQFSHDARD